MVSKKPHDSDTDRIRDSSGGCIPDDQPLFSQVSGDHFIDLFDVVFSGGCLRVDFRYHDRLI
jgi:hypothetical protein